MKFLPQATLLLSLAFGATAGTLVAGENGPVVINYWEKWTGFEAEAMQQIIDDFNASQKQVEVHFLSVNPVAVKLLLAASSGSPPDLAGLWSFSIPDFAEKGALTPLDGAMKEAGITEDHYVPIFWDLCRYKDFTWGLPTTPGCVALFYNKKLFREADLDPEHPPQTFEEFERVAHHLTRVELERGGRRVRVGFDELTAEERKRDTYDIVQVGHLPQDAGMFVSAWGLWFGATYYDGNRRILANDTGNLAALEWMRRTVTDYGLTHLRDFGAAFGQSQTSHSPFLAGKAAMVVQGPWMKNFIEKYAPDMEWGVAPCPSAQGGAPLTVVETDVIVVPRGAAHPKEAFEFIRYLQRQEVAEKLSMLQRKFTALREVSPTFVSQHPNPAIQTFIDLARSPGARTVPRLSIWREYDIEMSIAADKVRGLLASPKEALDEVQQRVQWRYDRVMRRWDIVKDERTEEWRTYARW